MIISISLLERWYKECNAAFFDGLLPVVNIVLANRTKSMGIVQRGDRISISNHYVLTKKEYKTLLLWGMYTIWQRMKSRTNSEKESKRNLLKAHGYDIFEDPFWKREHKEADGKEIGMAAKIKKQKPVYVFSWVSQTPRHKLGTKYFRPVNKSACEALYKKCKGKLWYGDLKLIRVVPDESLKGCKTQGTTCRMPGYYMTPEVEELINKGQNLTVGLEYFGKLLDQYEIVDC